jgi:serine/threonine protein kinase
LTLGIEYAHNNNLAHGTFCLENVVLSYDGDTPVYKVTNFTSGTAMRLPVSKEANFWPFVKGKSRVLEGEKLEILMLKDIYSLGITLLELMIGRHSGKKFSISLDSLPLTWAEYAESTALIQVLVECIQLDAIT